MAEREKIEDTEQSQDFFKTLSFYDDDPIDLPFESFFGPEDTQGTEHQESFPTEAPEAGNEVADTVIESVLENVVGQGVTPRKVATVHPFSMNNTENASSDQTPAIRLAKFAVDPASSSPASSSGGPVMTRPVLKLANFAVDPGASPGPPPLTQRPLFSPPASCRSPQLPSLTRAPSPQIAATPPPTPQAHNLACFGHFERELEYRYSFRTVDCNTHNGYIIFSSLDNVYIKLIVHESGLSVLPRDPNIWQSVVVKFINDQHSSWCFMTFRTKGQDGNQQMTIQAELPMDLNHFSALVQRKTNFVLSQSRVNALNSECLNTYRLGEISPSFYHVSKPKSYLRPNINNLGNECIDPNIRAEDRQKTVQWILSELRDNTKRDLPGRASHIENRVYDRFAKQGQVLFRFIHQYFAEIKKEMNTFILQSRKEPQILELLDPQMINSAMKYSSSSPQQSQHSPVRLPPGITLQPQSETRVKQEAPAQPVSTSYFSIQRETQANPQPQQPLQSQNSSYQQYQMSQQQPQYPPLQYQQNAQSSHQLLSHMERENQIQLQKMQKEREMREHLAQKEREMQRMEQQRRLQREMEQKMLMEQQRERERQLLIQSQQRERERIIRENIQQERLLEEQKKREQEQKYLELRRKQQEEQRILMMQKQQEEQRRTLIQQEQIRRQQQEQLRLQKIQEENHRQAQLRQQQEQLRLQKIQEENRRQAQLHQQQLQFQRHQEQLRLQQFQQASTSSE